MRVLVTGGAGYIGSATATTLMNAGHDVIVYDSLIKGYRAAVPEGAIFVQGDVGDAEALTAAFQTYQPEAVIHFAALIQAGESMEKPSHYFQNNVGKTITLLEVMDQQGVERIVFSSTAAVYASKDTPIAEDDPLGPTNVYAETKLMIERMLRWYHQTKGWRVCALRYFNACGALVDDEGDALHGEAHEPESHLIPLTLEVARGLRDKLFLFGTDYPTPDGTCVRDYIHIADLASAHVLALDALDERGNMVYNLGNGQGYSNREVIEVARQVSGHPIPIIESDRRPGDSPILIASSDKIKRELGWQPTYTNLTDIISTAWIWHKTHGYQKQEKA